MVGNAKTFLSTSKLKININLLQSLWFVVIASKRQILVIFLGFAMRSTVHVVRTVDRIATLEIANIRRLEENDDKTQRLR